MPVQTAIQVRRGTASSWTSTNPTLAAGEIGFETDTSKFKIGTGSTAWNSLNYFVQDPVTTKGDLYTFSTTDTRLAVGNNGETLVADSSTSTGLRWQGSYAAGKNFLINGGFDIWQRGTSSGSAGYQTADRWYQNASNTTTFAQETTTIPTDSRFAFKMTAGATAQMWIQQPIETLNAVRLAGKTIAVAADVSASTSTGMTINVYSSTTVDNTAAGTWGSAITPTSGGTGTAVSGSFTRMSGTYAIPSTAKSVMIQIITTSTVANGVVVYIGNVQAEIGSVPSAFTRAGGNIAGELAACQRYFNRIANCSQDANQMVAMGRTDGNTAESQYIVRNNVIMRGAPTLTVSSAGDFFVDGSARVTATSITGSQMTAISVNLVVAHAGISTYQSTRLFGKNSTGTLDLSAEL